MRVIIVLDKSTLDKVEKMAKKDGRSRKSMLEKIIKDSVK